MTGQSISPPTRIYTAPRRWETFERLFMPITREDDNLLWQPREMPSRADPQFWWTVLDPMTGTLHLAPGLHLVNRVGYVRCTNAWAGDACDHPEYLY
jgi:hypothetical protein